MRLAARDEDIKLELGSRAMRQLVRYQPTLLIAPRSHYLLRRAVHRRLVIRAWLRAGLLAAFSLEVFLVTCSWLGGPIKFWQPFVAAGFGLAIWGVHQWWTRR